MVEEELRKAVREYADAFKKDPVSAEAILEKYKGKIKDFEKWAGAIRGFIKMVRVRKANPHMHIEDVFERAMDS